VTGRGIPGSPCRHRTDATFRFREDGNGRVERFERRGKYPEVEEGARVPESGIHIKLRGHTSAVHDRMMRPACPEGEKKVVITSTYRYVLSPPAP